jgi:Ala-tRNA(Pro) deacylase
MALTERLREYLDQENIPYHMETHPLTFTARQVAAETQIPGKQVAKVVVAKDGDGEYLMAVIPANRRLNLEALAQASGRYQLDLATESEVGRLFPDCEIGAMPPFGNLYGLPLYVDTCFPRNAEFVFQPGNHHEVAEINFEQYDRHLRPILGEFCTRA